LVLRHPSRNPLPHLHPDVADLGGVRQLRGTQNDFVGRVIDQVHQAGVATGHLHRQSDQILEHFLQGRIGADDIADLVQ